MEKREINLFFIILDDPGAIIYQLPDVDGGYETVANKKGGAL